MHGDYICFVDDEGEDDLLGGRGGQQLLTDSQYGADEELEDVDIHELYVVLELATPATDAFR